MKYCVLIIDGAAGLPLPERGGKTCLKLANTPNLDAMTAEGFLGLVRTVPPGMEPSSACACMSVLGYDPVKYYKGRASIEAKSMGIDIGKGEVVFRCNLVTVRDGLMYDYSAGHIGNDEARAIIASLNEELGGSDVMFYPGVGYRHILKLKGHEEALRAVCTPPHDITGREIRPHLPKGADAPELSGLMEVSKSIFEDHPINRARRERQVNPATQVWLWGHGPAPSLPTFKETFGLDCALISAVNLLKSLGLFLELEVLDVPGITGFIDTDYDAKARYALEALQRRDLVFIHVEAPDECGHIGNVEKKVKSLERIDEAIIGPFISSEFVSRDELRLLICPDHSTPIALKTHATEPIPFLAWGPGFAAKGLSYDEKHARTSDVAVDPGCELMGRFIRAEFG